MLTDNVYITVHCVC